MRPMRSLMSVPHPYPEEEYAPWIRAAREKMERREQFDMAIVLRETGLAIEAVRMESDLPLVAMMTFAQRGKTALGQEAVAGREACLAAGADVVGVNCSGGAASVLEALKAMADGYAGPLAAEPSAGLPRWRNGKRRYDQGPALLARFALRYVRAGARLVGGCCGTTPAHISALRRALL